MEAERGRQGWREGRRLMSSVCIDVRAARQAERAAAPTGPMWFELRESERVIIFIISSSLVSRRDCAETARGGEDKERDGSGHIEEGVRGRRERTEERGKRIEGDEE
jgi:hypothetical protein